MAGGVCSRGGVVEGHAWWGHVWWGACVVGGHTWQGACVTGEHVWQGSMCGRGACMAGGVHGGGGMCGRRNGHYSGQYASYWNAFFFKGEMLNFFHRKTPISLEISSYVDARNCFNIF